MGSPVDHWPLSTGDDVRDDLLRAYGDPARGYHDVRHLTEVLSRLDVGSSRVDLQACKLEYSIVSPK